MNAAAEHLRHDVTRAQPLHQSPILVATADLAALLAERDALRTEVEALRDALDDEWRTRAVAALTAVERMRALVDRGRRVVPGPGGPTVQVDWLDSADVLDALDGTFASHEDAP